MFSSVFGETVYFFGLRLKGVRFLTSSNFGLIGNFLKLEFQQRIKKIYYK